MPLDPMRLGIPVDPQERTAQRLADLERRMNAIGADGRSAGWARSTDGLAFDHGDPGPLYLGPEVLVRVPDSGLVFVMADVDIQPRAGTQFDTGNVMLSCDSVGGAGQVNFDVIGTAQGAVTRTYYTTPATTVGTTTQQLAGAVVFSRSINPGVRRFWLTFRSTGAGVNFGLRNLWAWTIV